VRNASGEVGTDLGRS